MEETTNLSTETFTPRETDLLAYRYANSETEKARIVDLIGGGLSEDGFVQLHDSSVLKRDMLDRAQDAADWLLNHTDAELAPYEWPEIGRQMAFCPFGIERARDSAVRNANRYWHIWMLPTRDEHVLREYAKRGKHARNLWPRLGKPEEWTEFQVAMTALFDPFSLFAVTVAEILEQYLDLPPGTIKDRLRGGESIMRLLDYPARHHWPKGEFIRNVEHEDIAWFTFLATARSLYRSNEFQNLRGGVWTPLVAKPGAVLVNAGAKLAFSTNGRIKSVRHRVVSPEDLVHWRRIITCFVHDKPWDVLSVFPSCRRNDGSDPPDESSEDFTNRFLKENYGM